MLYLINEIMNLYELQTLSNMKNKEPKLHISENGSVSISSKELRKTTEFQQMLDKFAAIPVKSSKRDTKK